MTYVVPLSVTLHSDKLVCVRTTGCAADPAKCYKQRHAIDFLAWCSSRTLSSLLPALVLVLLQTLAASCQLLAAMDRYQKVEKPRRQPSAINENEVRITAQGLVRNYVSYATSLLQVRIPLRPLLISCRLTIRLGEDAYGSLLSFMYNI